MQTNQSRSLPQQTAEGTVSSWSSNNAINAIDRTHQPWTRFVIHRSLTSMEVDTITWWRHAVRHGNVAINIYVTFVRQTINETLYNRSICFCLYTLSTMNNIVHDKNQRNFDFLSLKCCRWQVLIYILKTWRFIWQWQWSFLSHFGAQHNEQIVSLRKCGFSNSSSFSLMG